MTQLIAFGIPVLFTLGLALLITLMFMCISWSCSLDYGIKIKFAAFKKFYAINPNRWDIYGDHAACNTITYSREQFHFGFIDFIRYRWWFKGYKKRKRIEKENEIMKKMLDSVKRDIEKTEREAKRYQEKARDFMEWHGGGSVG